MPIKKVVSQASPTLSSESRDILTAQRLPASRPDRVTLFRHPFHALGAAMA
jgi:hypothetical protein